MKIMIFLHGTAIMHKNGFGKTPEERSQQIVQNETSVHQYEDYIPVDNAVSKLIKWQQQGAKISYLSSHESALDVEKDKLVLKKYVFPKGEVYYRNNGESYASVAEKVIPDILIEDDCKSIGGKTEMTYPQIKPLMKEKIKSIVVKEFSGVDNLPDNIEILRNY